MAKKSLEQLLREAKKRQKSRARTLKRTQDAQKDIPRIPLGVVGPLTSGLRNPTLAEAAQLAFTNRILEAALIAGLEGQSIGSAVDSEPNITPQEIPQVVRELRPAKRGGKTPRTRSDKQLINDAIQSDAFKAVNKRARKKDGSYKKGWDFRRVALMAQKECTKERQRLGLCEKPMKKRKRK